MSGRWGQGISRPSSHWWLGSPRSPRTTRHCSRIFTNCRMSRSKCSAGPHEHRRHLEGLGRSEEHTSELQSPCNLVCRLLLEKKNSNFTIEFLHLSTAQHLNSSTS